MNFNLKREMKRNVVGFGIEWNKLQRAAMATIDRHRALLHGEDVNDEIQFFVMNLKDKLWMICDFNVKPSPRSGHTICQLVKHGFDDKSICLLIGGRMFDEAKSDYVDVLDCGTSKAYQMDVYPKVGAIYRHTYHCVRNKDDTIVVFACCGRNRDFELNPIISSFHLDFENELYMEIERDIVSPRNIAETLSQHLSLSSEEIEMMQHELAHLRQRCVDLAEEKRREQVEAQRRFDEEKASIREELASSQQEVQRKDGAIAQISEQLASVQKEASVAQRETSLAQRRLEQQKDEQISSIREQLAAVRIEASAAQRRHRDELAVALTRCQTLGASRDEMQGRLDEFINVFNVNPDEVHVTDQKLGSEAFAGAFVGQWRGMTVAVKQIHNLIANQHNIEMFKQEVLVCSRLHHPNIMTVCGAVMVEGIPFQMVMELLEGSVSEVITAAHASGSYLTIYEQLSIAMDMTSGIAYLHQIRPRPYVHGDIRPSNILVTRDMTVKVGDLEAAYLIESSLSTGPLSPPYLAPEREPRPNGTAASSTLLSDMYSVGVSLIEIFTGAGPVPEMRQTQLDALAGRPNLLMLHMLSVNWSPPNQSASSTIMLRNAED